MSVAFEKTIYLRVIKKDEDFRDEGKILHHVKQGLQFKYGSVCQEEFNKKYSAKDWGMRKVVALPTAAWAGSVQLVYHLAKAIFAGIPKAFSDRGLYLKVQIFNIARDVQEVYGRIASLFNDRYGRFHVQESRFQRTCYENFIGQTQLGSKTSRFSEVRKLPFSSNSSSSLNSNITSSDGIFSSFSYSRTLKYDVWVDDQAGKISLLNYKEKTPEERRELAKKFNFQISFELLGSKRSLDEFVDQADEETLKALTLEDLIIPVQHSKLKFALLSKEEFNALTLEEFQGEMNLDQISFVRLRLKENSKKEEMESQLKNLADYEDKTKILLKDLIRFSSADIFEHRESIPDAAFIFLTNDQLKGLKISQMRLSQNKALFLALNEEEIRERLAVFEEQDLIEAITEVLIPGNILKILRNEHLKYVPLSRLSQDIIEELFPRSSDNKDDLIRFAKFDPNEVQAALNAGLIRGNYRLGLLSDDQLKLVQLSKLHKDIIEELFPKSSDNKGDLKRFANFDPNEVQIALHAGKIRGNYRLRLLSDDQLQRVGLSKLHKDIIEELFPRSSDNKNDLLRFANFDPNEVQAALQAGKIRGNYRLGLLSDDQLKLVQLSKLHKDIIEEMFPQLSDNKNDMKRFANFHPSEVQYAFDNYKLNHYQISLISIEQLREFAFWTMKQELINMLFPPYSIDGLREKHSYLSSSFAMRNGKVLENESGRKCSYSEEELKKMSKDQQQKNEERLAQLSQEQREDLAPFLDQETASSESLEIET